MDAEIAGDEVLEELERQRQQARARGWTKTEIKLEKQQLRLLIEKTTDSDALARYGRRYQELLLEESVQGALWVRASRNQPEVLPNGCPTCANSPKRLDLSTESEPSSIDELTEKILARYKYAKQRDDVRVRVVSPEHIQQQCGPTAFACVEGDRATSPRDVILLPESAPNRTKVHELIHTRVSSEWARRVPWAVDESTTEYFTRKLGYFHPDFAVLPKAYEGGQRLLDDYIRDDPRRADALEKAYFAGDFSDLERLETGAGIAPPTGFAARIKEAVRPTTPLDARLADWQRKLLQ